MLGFMDQCTEKHRKPATTKMSNMRFTIDEVKLTQKKNKLSS